MYLKSFIVYMYNNLILLGKQGSQCLICFILIIINIGWQML